MTGKQQEGDQLSVILIDETWGSQSPGRLTTLPPAPGATEPRVVACRKGFDEVMERAGEGRYRLRDGDEDVYFRVAPNVTLDPAQSPEGVSLRLTVPGATEEEIARGMRAAEAHFQKCGVTPYTAAYALFYLEGDFDVPKQAVDWANAWLTAPQVAVAACCEGWQRVPTEGCDLSLSCV